MKKMLALTAIVSAASVNVQAGAIQIQNVYGTTDSFSAFGASDLFVTSNYSHSLGANVVTSVDDLIGELVTFADSGTGSIGQLAPLLGTTSTVGYGDDWRIDFDYSVGGVATFVDCIFGAFCSDGTLDANNDGKIDAIDAIVPTFTYGTFTFRYVDLTGADGFANDTFLTLTLDTAEIDGANVVFHTLVDSVDETYATLLYPSTGKSFGELFGESIPITMRADFNVDPNYTPTCVDTACETLTRTTDVNITARFNVPEPSSVALFGLGLLGLGATARRKA